VRSIKRVGIFIDGAYLDRVLKDEFRGIKIDFKKLVAWLAQDLDVLRTYYYHCEPYISEDPTHEETDRVLKASYFYDRLSLLDGFETRLGKLEYRGLNHQGQPIFTQKKVDLLLGVDLVRFALKKNITHAVIFTGDSDFIPALDVAKEEGVHIILGHGTLYPPHQDLKRCADQRVRLTAYDVKQMQLHKKMH